MHFEMESDLFSLLEERPGADFDSESPTINSGELNIGVDDNTRHQMTTNPTTDQASVYSQDSPVHNKVHRGGNRQYSGLDLMEIRRQREINKAKKEAADLDQSFILEKLAEVEPVAVTFFDKATGIEFDAEGNEISRTQLELDNEEGLYATDPSHFERTQQWGNPHRRNPYGALNTQNAISRHHDAAHNSHKNPINAEGYPTNQQVYLHHPMNHPVNQPIYQPVNQATKQPANQQAYQPGNQQAYQPGNQPVNQPMYPYMNQWNAAQYPQNAARQPYNNQTNVWSTNQAHTMITQQPIPQSAQPTFYHQPPIPVTYQDVMRTESYGCYIAISIFTIVFCCIPLGAIGLKLSIHACILYRERQFVDAEHHAKTACGFNVAAIVVGVILYISLSVWYLKFR